MSDGAEGPIPTPILGLEQPFPGRQSRLLSQVLGFAVGFGAALLLLTSNYREGNPLYLYFLIVASIFGAILVHELGHLAVGRIVGFHFNSIRVGWLSLAFEYGKLKLRVRRDFHIAGYAGIQTDGVRRIRKRLAWFILGGPAANLLSVVAVVLIVNAFNLNDPSFETPAGVFAFMSLLIGLTSLAPYGHRQRSDGARLMMLKTSREKTTRWLCLCALARQYRLGKGPKSWNAHWIKQATAIRDSTTDEQAARWLAYLAASDRKQADPAAYNLERCLELAGQSVATVRDTLALEAAVHTAWFRNDADKSARWLAQVKSPKQVPKLMQLRGAVALACAKGDFDGAIATWKDGQAMIARLPVTSVNGSLTNAWSEWLAEIQEKQAGATAHQA
jgi:hypothetical protein